MRTGETVFTYMCVYKTHLELCVCGGREQEEASWGHLAISGDISCCHRVGCCGQSGKQPRTLLDIPQEQNSTIVMWPPVPRLRTPDLAGLTEPYNVGFNAGYHSRRASLVAQWSGIHLQCRRPGSIPRSGRSPGEVNGSPHQYSCLENSMDRGAWWAKVHGVAELDMTEQLTHTHTTEGVGCGWEGFHFTLFQALPFVTVSLFKVNNQMNSPDRLLLYVGSQKCSLRAYNQREERKAL